MANHKSPFLRVMITVAGAAGALAAVSPAMAQETCATAQPIKPGFTFYDNTAATTDGPSNCGQLGADLWYSFTASGRGVATISTCNQTFMDTVLNAYTACDGTSIVCTDDSCGLQTTISFPVAPGEDYFLQLGGFAGELGTGAFEFTFRLDGACCTGSACEVVSEAACLAQNGVYRGDGVTCAAAQCAQLGACCLPATEGLCRIMLQDECVSAGGVFSGAGTSCAGASPFNGAALVFDGASSDVDMGDVPAFSFTTAFTIEAWVRPASIAGVTRFVSKGAAGIPGSDGYGFGQRDGRLRFTAYGILDYETAAAYLAPDRWTHVAVVFDQFASATFFVNGVFVESIAGSTPPAPSARAFQIGANAEGVREHFSGVIDEVRVWNIERSFQEISDNFDNQVSGGDFGLVGYWRLDDAQGSATAADLSPTGATGTRHNTVWISTQTCESATFGACCLPSGACTLTSASGCALSGGDYSGNGTTCGGVTCPQPGACCLPAALGLCRVLLPDDCAALGGVYSGPGTTCDGVGPFEGAALQLNGGNDGVNAGNVPSLTLTSGFTLEAWIYPTIVTNVHRPIAKGQPGVEGYGFGVYGGGRFRFTTSGIQDYNTVGSYVQANRWTHIAVVFTSTFRADYYVNGQFVESVQGNAPARTSALPFYIGRNAAGLTDAFVGRVDDIRVWNIERSAAQIAAAYNQQVSNDAPGLVANWRLDEGSGTTATDSVQSITGTFTGGPSWVSTAACGGCPADWNNSGDVNSQDFFDFLTDFFDEDADFNSDGITNSQDFFDFLSAFFTKC